MSEFKFELQQYKDILLTQSGDNPYEFELKSNTDVLSFYKEEDGLNPRYGIVFDKVAVFIPESISSTKNFEIEGVKYDPVPEIPGLENYYKLDDVNSIKIKVSQDKYPSELIVKLDGSLSESELNNAMKKTLPFIFIDPDIQKLKLTAYQLGSRENIQYLSNEFEGIISYDVNALWSAKAVSTDPCDTESMDSDETATTSTKNILADLDDDGNPIMEQLEILNNFSISF